jgi:hypothetical protein
VNVALSRKVLTQVKEDDYKMINGLSSCFLYASDQSKLDKRIAKISKQFLFGTRIFYTRDTNLMKMFKIDAPSLCIIKNGSLKRLFGVESKAENEIAFWMNQVQYPYLVEMSETNSKDLLGTNRTLMLAVVTDDSMKANLSNIAVESPIQFVYLNGTKYKDFVDNQFGRLELPSLLVFNTEKGLYYKVDSNGEKITTENFKEVYEDIRQGKVEGKSTKSFAFRAASGIIQVSKTLPLIYMASMIVILIGIFLYFRSRGEYSKIE